MKQFVKYVFSLVMCLLGNSPLYASDEFSVILSTYNANQARFHKNFKGKAFNGEGFIKEIRADVMGTGRIFFVDIDGSGGSRIKCTVSDMNLAASLNKSDSIDFSGIIDDVVLNVLNLDNCKFQDNAIRKLRSMEHEERAECTDILVLYVRLGVHNLYLCDYLILPNAKSKILAQCKIGSWCSVRGLTLGANQLTIVVNRWEDFYDVRELSGKNFKKYFRYMR
jgi:hypothetical protein